MTRYIRPSVQIAIALPLGAAAFWVLGNLSEDAVWTVRAALLLSLTCMLIAILALLDLGTARPARKLDGMQVHPLGIGAKIVAILGCWGTAAAAVLPVCLWAATKAMTWPYLAIPVLGAGAVYMTLITLRERIAWTEQAISGPLGWRWTPRWHAWSDLERIEVDRGESGDLIFRTGRVSMDAWYVATDDVLERAKDELARRGNP